LISNAGTVPCVSISNLDIVHYVSISNQGIALEYLEFLCPKDLGLFHWFVVEAEANGLMGFPAHLGVVSESICSNSVLYHRQPVIGAIAHELDQADVFGSDEKEAWPSQSVVLPFLSNV
jgi:hypothetical protein